jgi:[acyl-carrier-protein] S-malonyltransferase
LIVFVFPGQGAQYVGMGADLAVHHPAARAVFEEASDTIGIDVLRLCREGPDERLRETENTQPAILTVSWAVARVLNEAGVWPAMVAGLSLGEYTALVAAGALRFSDAVAVVRQRGRFMQEAALGRDTAMAAVLGLEGERVAEICAETPGFVEAANFNAPGQVAVAGDAAAVAAAGERLRAAGARRVVPLAVSAPFHTSLMRPAAERLAVVIAATPVFDPAIPVIANVHARPVRTAAEVREALVAQVSSPVRWEQSVGTMRDAGAATFVEVGPGTSLAGLVRKTVPGVTALSVENQTTIDAALAALKQASGAATASGRGRA